jgi:hypothetical protein
MIHPDNQIGQQAARYRPLLQQLAKLFDSMDDAYTVAADRYGFFCKGCADNCCLTRFYHHTLLEYLSLMEGFYRLDEEMQLHLRHRAEAICRQYEKGDAGGFAVRSMCPLNVEGMCCLYRHRPMICRLHGIPHELRKPDSSVAYGPGCEAFDNHCGKKRRVSFDRTPYYMKMAGLERDLKQALDVSGKIKMTVAEMVLQFDPLLGPRDHEIR